MSQDIAPQLSTPETYKLRHCCPAGATYPERRLGKSQVPVANLLPAMFKFAIPVMNHKQ
jgi:hypothetical protein